MATCGVVHCSAGTAVHTDHDAGLSLPNPTTVTILSDTEGILQAGFLKNSYFSFNIYNMSVLYFDLD